MQLAQLLFVIGPVVVICMQIPNDIELSPLFMQIQFLNSCEETAFACQSDIAHNTGSGFFLLKNSYIESMCRHVLKTPILNEFTCMLECETIKNF